MLIANTILRKTRTNKEEINVCYSHTDNISLIKILTKILGKSSVIKSEDSIYSHKCIDIVICNNKIENLDKSISLAFYFHCPLLIIDHAPKQNALHNFFTPPNITYFQAALSKPIANSWGMDEYHYIFDLDITNESCRQKLFSSLEHISQTKFKVNQNEPAQ